MKKIIINILLLLLIEFVSPIQAATIRGTIKFEDGAKSFEICAVRIIHGEVEGPVDRDGNFVINNVPIGKDILYLSAITYILQIDTIVIKNENQTVNLNITLRVPWVRSSASTEEYHHNIGLENEKSPIISINLDCFVFRDGFITVHPSFTNNSNIPLMILRIYGCINPIKAIVRDSSGEIIRPNMGRSDCLGVKIFPTRDDIINLPGHQTVDYPPAKLENYNFKLLPEGKYTIQLSYSFEKPERLCCYGFKSDYQEKYSDEIRTLTFVLRGYYISKNSITFINKN